MAHYLYLLDQVKQAKRMEGEESKAKQAGTGQGCVR